MDFVAWLKKRCSEGQSKALQFLVRGFSPAAGTAQIMLQRKKMANHIRADRSRGGERAKRGGFGNTFIFPKHTLLPPGAGAGPGPQQHRVACAPSAGPAAAARPSAPLRAPGAGGKVSYPPRGSPAALLGGRAAEGKRRNNKSSTQQISSGEGLPSPVQPSLGCCCGWECGPQRRERMGVSVCGPPVCRHCREKVV